MASDSEDSSDSDSGLRNEKSSKEKKNKPLGVDLGKSKIPSTKEKLIQKNDGKERREKSKQSTTKQSIKHETLFEQGQQINWVEMNESKTTFEKRFITKNSLLDKNIHGITNDKNVDPQRRNKIPIAHPFLPTLSPPYPMNIQTIQATDLSRNQSEFPKNAVSKQSDSKTLGPNEKKSPNNLNFFTLENPLKISDSFESPPIEVRSVNILKQRMGIKGDGEWEAGEKKENNIIVENEPKKSYFNMKEESENVLNMDGKLKSLNKVPPLPARTFGTLKNRGELTKTRMKSYESVMSNKNKVQNQRSSQKTKLVSLDMSSASGINIHTGKNSSEILNNQKIFEKNKNNKIFENPGLDVSKKYINNFSKLPPKNIKILEEGSRNLNSRALDQMFARKGSIRFADDSEEHKNGLISFNFLNKLVFNSKLNIYYKSIYLLRIRLGLKCTLT